jgi:uncharacterized protein YabE (DUF348 family)
MIKNSCPPVLTAGCLTSVSLACRIALLSAEIAQLVEHATENRGVASSILALGIQTPTWGFLFFLIQSHKMEILKKYGKPAAILMIGVGIFLMLYAWYISPKSFSAEIWTRESGTPVQIEVSDLIAANWLQEAGIRLFPGDSILYSGVEIDPNFHLPARQSQQLIYQPGYPITVTNNEGRKIFYSSAPTLGAALWEQQIMLTASDVVSLPLNLPVISSLEVVISTAAPLVIQVGDLQIKTSSAAATVGEALADAGVALQNLDESSPAEDQPVPSDGIINVVRVREETIFEETPIAFSEERMADAEMVLGQEEVRQTGENGVQVASLRVRYENDEEISRTVEREWVSRAPVSQIVAYGSQVVVQTSADSNCFVDYYMAKQVYVTSYHDTGQTTASGVWPYYGVIAVSPEWYSILKGSSICVPGYGVGTVLDVCPGCSGKNWLDVFLPTADYVSWNTTLTAYFMSPVPAGFTGDLP